MRGRAEKLKVLNKSVIGLARRNHMRSENGMKRNEMKPGIVTAVVGGVTLPVGKPVVSIPAGSFSMYIHDEAMKLISDEGKLELEEIRAIPQLVYDKCQALGLVRQDPIHFILNCNEGRRPEDSGMAITKIVPPIPIADGQEVRRSIVIFKPPFCFDQRNPENIAVARHALFSGPLDPGTRAKILAPYRQFRRAKCLVGLAHELVHIFMTDEFTDRFQSWDLETLELLTDAIAVDLFYPKVSQSGDFYTMGGFIEAAAYISNELRKTMGSNNPRALIRAMNERAQELIALGRKRLTPTSGGSLMRLRSDSIAS
jgi:hypothetical protein